MHTLEDAMKTLGLNVDGVGTTELAGVSAGLPLFKGLTDPMKDLMQLMIERGYTEKQVRLLSEWYLRVRKAQ